MKKALIILSLMVGTMAFTQQSKAQLRIGVNLRIGLPSWIGPDYNDAEFYYFPDIECYYDVALHQFVYMVDGDWVYSSYLPDWYSDYDLYSAYKVPVYRKYAYRFFDEDRVRYVRRNYITPRYDGFDNNRYYEQNRDRDDRWRNNNEWNRERMENNRVYQTNRDRDRNENNRSFEQNRDQFNNNRNTQQEWQRNNNQQNQFNNNRNTQQDWQHNSAQQNPNPNQFNNNRNTQQDWQHNNTQQNPNTNQFNNNRNTQQDWQHNNNQQNFNQNRTNDNNREFRRDDNRNSGRDNSQHNGRFGGRG